MIKLRENQIEPIEKAIKFFSESKKEKPSLMVLPTAWGKSILIAWVANTLKENVLVIQPSKELLEQNYWKYINLCSDETTVSVYSASFNSKEISQVTFCTIGSIKSKGLEFKSLGFKRVLIDEAHMYPRESTGMLRTFIEELNPSHVLGVTATPFKLQTNTDMSGNPFSKLVCLTNRSKKGNFFKDIIHVSQIQEMIKLGFWSRLEYISEDIDESSLIFNSTKAEFTDFSIERSFVNNNIKERIWKAYEHLKTEHNCKHTLIFVPSVTIAIEMKQQYGGSVVYSGMKSKERDEEINNFKNGTTSFIWNVRILSTGFDYTEIDSIIYGYSTASLTNYYQIIGRGTRIHDNKEKCIIYDLGGNYKRFGRVEDMVMIQLSSGWEMISETKLITSKPIHLLNSPPTFWFGRFNGINLQEVPIDYLKWAIENVKLDLITRKEVEVILKIFENLS